MIVWLVARLGRKLGFTGWPPETLAGIAREAEEALNALQAET